MWIYGKFEARSILQNLRNRWNWRKIIITFLSSMKQPKNYLSAYSDTLSRILSVKNQANFIFRQFRDFGYGPTRKSENAEFAESFRNFHLLYQCTIWSLDTIIYIQYRLLFKITLFVGFFFKQKLGNKNFVCPSEKRS